MGANLHLEVGSFYFTSFNLFIYFYEERKGGENFRKNKKTKKQKNKKTKTKTKKTSLDAK